MKPLDWKRMTEGPERYAAYLASREWAVRKVAVRERSGGTCEHCKHDQATQCHHQTYIRKYYEPLTDLLDVCAPCHAYLSGKSKEDPRDYWREITSPPYRYACPSVGDNRKMVECPKCRGEWNQVHADAATDSNKGASHFVVVPFWCECGCEFHWIMEDRKGFTYIEYKITGQRELR